MTEFTVVDNAESLYQAIDSKRAEGYKDYELSVLSKSKLHLDELHDSEINLTSTGGTFSDKVDWDYVKNLDTSSPEYAEWRKKVGLR